MCLLWTSDKSSTQAVDRSSSGRRYRHPAGFEGIIVVRQRKRPGLILFWLSAIGSWVVMHLLLSKIESYEQQTRLQSCSEIKRAGFEPNSTVGNGRRLLEEHMLNVRTIQKKLSHSADFSNLGI